MPSVPPVFSPPVQLKRPIPKVPDAALHLVRKKGGCACGGSCGGCSAGASVQAKPFGPAALQLKNEVKAQQARARNAKKQASRGVSGKGAGHTAGLNTALTCYKNTNCSGSTRQFTSAHNCCAWGKSWQAPGQACTNCSKSKHRGNSKH